MHLHSLMHTHTSVHTFPWIPRVGKRLFWNLGHAGILNSPDPKSPSTPVHTSQGAHSSCHTCVTLLSHTTYKSTYCSMSISKNSYPGASSGHCSVRPPPSFPTKPCFLFSFSGRIEWYTMAVVSSLTIPGDFHCFHCCLLPAYLLSVVRPI